MMRFLLVIFGFVLASVIQLSFFSMLPEPLSYTPFLLVVAVYMIQRFGMTVFAWWLLFYGLILDFHHLSGIPFESLCFMVAAVVVVFSSQSLFSNRSFYGVLGATIVTVLSVSVCELLIILLQFVFHFSHLSISTFLIYILWRIVLATVLLFLMYSFGKKTLNLERLLDRHSTFSA